MSDVSRDDQAKVMETASAGAKLFASITSQSVWPESQRTGIFVSGMAPRGRAHYSEGGTISMLNIMAVGFMNIPLRLARFYANYSPYGLARYGYVADARAQQLHIGQGGEVDGRGIERGDVEG